MPFFAVIPATITRPMNDDRLSVIQFSSSAMKLPAIPQDGAQHDRYRGRQPPELPQQHEKHRDDGGRQGISGA